MATDYGKRLKAARKHAKLTQIELAAKVKITQGTLSELETIGHGSAYTIQLAKACGVDPEWLASGEGAMVTAGTTVPLVGERPSHYAAAEPWPLPGITREQISSLDAATLEQVAGHIKLVLEHAIAPQPADTSWRAAALRLAASADLQDANNGDRFTQFCLAVDAQVAKATRDAQPRPRKRAVKSTK